MRPSILSLFLIILSLSLFALGVLSVINVVSFSQGNYWINLFNLPSILIIVGGLSVHALISFPVPELFKAISRLIHLASHKVNGKAILMQQGKRFLEWQRLLREDRLDTAEKLSQDLEGRFEGYLFSLFATNYDVGEVRDLGMTWINAAYEANLKESNVMNTLGNASPAYGMLGTLMGLIYMLQNYQAATYLGIGLSLALMTTLYGLALAQFVWYPLSNKIRLKADMIANNEHLTLQAFVMLMEDKPGLYIRDFFTANIR